MSEVSETNDRPFEMQVTKLVNGEWIPMNQITAAPAAPEPLAELAALRHRVAELAGALDLYRQFYEIAADMDCTGEMTDLTNYSDDEIKAWAEAVALIDSIKAMRLAGTS